MAVGAEKSLATFEDDFSEVGSVSPAHSDETGAKGSGYFVSGVVVVSGSFGVVAGGQCLLVMAVLELFLKKTSGNILWDV